MKIEHNTTPYWDIQSLNTKKDLDTVTKEFEAVFLKIILKEFRKTVPQGLFNSSFSSKMYIDMMDMTIAEKLSEKDTIGLQRFIKDAIDAYMKNSGGK